MNRYLINSQHKNSFQKNRYIRLPSAPCRDIVDCPLHPGRVIQLCLLAFQESMFIFRVLSRQPVRMKLHDSLPQLVRSPIVQAQNSTKGLSQYQSIFMQVADEHKCVNAFDLQELLDVCLPNGETDTLMHSNLKTKTFNPCLNID